MNHNIYDIIFIITINKNIQFLKRNNSLQMEPPVLIPTSANQALMCNLIAVSASPRHVTFNS